MNSSAICFGLLSLVLPTLAAASARNTTCDRIEVIAARYENRPEWLIRAASDTRRSTFLINQDLKSKLHESADDLAELASLLDSSGHYCVLGSAYRKMGNLPPNVLVLDSVRATLHEGINDVHTGLGLLLSSKVAQSCLGASSEGGHRAGFQKLPNNMLTPSGRGLQTLPNYDLKNSPKGRFVPLKQETSSGEEEADSYGAQ